MALTPPGWGISPWADPRWWAGQQIKVMTATTTYLGRVAQAWAGVRVLDAPAPVPTLAPEPEPATPVEELPATPVEEPPAVLAEEPPAEELAAEEPVAEEPVAEVLPAEEHVAEEPHAAPDEELPVPRWDELSLGSIRARLARLSEADLAQLRQYEEGHGARPDVLSMLTNRLIKVRQAG